MFLLDINDPNFLTNYLLYFYKALYLLFELVIQQNGFVLIQALVSKYFRTKDRNRLRLLESIISLHSLNCCDTTVLDG